MERKHDEFIKYIDDYLRIRESEDLLPSNHDTGIFVQNPGTDTHIADPFCALYAYRDYRLEKKRLVRVEFGVIYEGTKEGFRPRMGVVKTYKDGKRQTEFYTNDYDSISDLHAVTKQSAPEIIPRFDVDEAIFENLRKLLGKKW